MSYRYMDAEASKISKKIVKLLSESPDYIAGKREDWKHVIDFAIQEVLRGEKVFLEWQGMNIIKDPIEYLEQQADGFREIVADGGVVKNPKGATLGEEYRNWKAETEHFASFYNKGFLSGHNRKMVDDMLGIVKEEFKVEVGDDKITVFREGDKVTILIGDSEIKLKQKLTNGEVIDFVFSIRDSFDFRK